jgi:formate/nitrite transporter
MPDVELPPVPAEWVRAKPTRNPTPRRPLRPLTGQKRETAVSGDDGNTGDLDPQAIPARAASATADQVVLGTGSLLVLAFLAGVFIAFGSVFSLVVLSAPEAAVPFGVLQLLAGLAFSLGLILVIVAGAELFTGNTLMVTLWLQDENSWSEILRAWGLAYLGNLVGSLFVVVLFVVAGGHEAGDGLFAAAAVELAGDKTAMGAPAILASGVLANMLVCLAVWMTFAARTVQGKIVALVPPIAAFVAAGFEHSVANMSLIPFGLAALWVEGGAGDPTLGLAGFGWNLLWSTLGNVVGGALIAACYWKAYAR